jgi:Flp pilus assembly protein TadG
MFLTRSPKKDHDGRLSRPVGPSALRAAALLRGDQGAVAVIFAICGSMMIASLCIALDTIDGGMTQSRMQSALDVATLSAGVDLKHVPAGLSAAQWQKDARAYYNANMPAGYMSLTMPDSGFSATLSGSPSTGETIQLSAAGTLHLIAPVVVPGGAGSGSGSGSGGQTLPTTTPLAANNTALYLPQSTLELALVLDNTGSMADPASSGSSQGTKIEGLRTAANALVSNIFGQPGNNSYIGLVPFTTMVNVGTSLLPTGSWITPAASDPNSYNSAGISMMVQPSGTGSGWAGCPVEPRVGSGNLYPLAYAPASSPGFTPFYYNVPKAGFKITNYSTVTKGTSCPVSSVNTVMNVPLTYQTNGSPTCGTSIQATVYNSWFQPPATGKNAPATTTWDQNGNSDSNARPCSIQPMLFLTQNQTTLTTAINKMTANGSTIIPTGLLWGWRMVSSAWSPQVSAANGWVSSDPNLPRPEATTPGLQRVVIVLTDGENDPGVASGIMPSPSFNGLSGVGNSALTAPTVGPTNGSMTSVPDINTFQLAVCTAMKNDGVTIYSITFGTYGTDTTSVQAQQTMQNCASPGNYYHAPTNASLTAIFEQIAGNLGVLRLTR